MSRNTVAVIVLIVSLIAAVSFSLGIIMVGCQPTSDIRAQQYDSLCGIKVYTSYITGYNITNYNNTYALRMTVKYLENATCTTFVSNFTSLENATTYYKHNYEYIFLLNIFKIDDTDACYLTLEKYSGIVIGGIILLVCAASIVFGFVIMTIIRETCKTDAIIYKINA